MQTHQKIVQKTTIRFAAPLCLTGLMEKQELTTHNQFIFIIYIFYRLINFPTSLIILVGIVYFILFAQLHY